MANAVARSASLGCNADEGVLAAAQEGAELALAAPNREFHPGLLRYIASQTPDNGEDLAADVWLAAASGPGVPSSHALIGIAPETSAPGYGISHSPKIGH